MAGGSSAEALRRNKAQKGAPRRRRVSAGLIIFFTWPAHFFELCSFIIFARSRRFNSDRSNYYYCYGSYNDIVLTPSDLDLIHLKFQRASNMMPNIAGLQKLKEYNSHEKYFKHYAKQLQKHRMMCDGIKKKRGI